MEATGGHDDTGAGDGNTEWVWQLHFESKQDVVGPENLQRTADQGKHEDSPEQCLVRKNMKFTQMAALSTLEILLKGRNGIQSTQ